VPGTEERFYPTFSPDGEWLLFRYQTQNALVRVSTSGGGALTLVSEEGVSPSDPHWGADGTIAFTSPQGLYVVPASGSGARRIADSGGRKPHMLPDGSGVLAAPGGGVRFVDAAADTSWLLIPEGRHPVYVETGHILYVPPGGGLFAQAFDLASHTVSGSPFRVLDRVSSTPLRRGYSVSRGGTLVHYEGSGAGSGQASTRFLLMDRSGGVDTIPLPAANRSAPRFSRDGRSIVYESYPGGADADIHTFDLLTDDEQQITFDAADDEEPLWSPDGTRVVFDREQQGGDEDLFIKLADNSAPEELLLARPGDQNARAWLDDDRILFESEEAAGMDIYVLSLAEGAEPEPYLQAPWEELGATLSPEGGLVAYRSNESGSMDIWLRTFPDPTGKWRVSTGGGFAPRWAPDGSGVYFWQNGPVDTLKFAPVEREPSVRVRAPEPVLGVDARGTANWDLHPDGERFLVTVAASTNVDQGADAGTRARHLVVLNWFEELRARVSEGS
jgi:Tol biopolymer transport system component